MKKFLILLAVATLPATSGCACARLCPCCPCNWFNRPVAYCPPPAYAAPCAAPMATCAPTCAPVSPCAPVATMAPYMPAMAQQYAPQCATCAAPQGPPVITQAQPMYYQAPAAANCCGAPANYCGSSGWGLLR